MQFIAQKTLQTVTVVPADYDYIGQSKKLIPGLRVQFEEGELDTEEVQRKKNLTDEQRLHLEDVLQNRDDCRQAGIQVKPDIDALRAGDLLGMGLCTFVVTIDGDIEACGRPVVSEAGLCAKHARMVEDTNPRIPEPV